MTARRREGSTGTPRAAAAGGAGDRAPAAPESATAVAMRTARARLEARGVPVHGLDTADDLAQLLESVERFERAVERRGGDLMMDEPPPRQPGAPDDPRFRLPVRHARDDAATYLLRLADARDRLPGR